MTRGDLTVSVVIAAWNVEPWLGDALASVRAQTVPVAEVIVVDDGSTDGTAAVAGRDSNVRLLQQENQGFGAARNAGAAAAIGDAILFLDADDVLDPDAVAGLAEAAAAHPDWSVVVPNHRNDDGGPPGWETDPAVRVFGRKDLLDVLATNPLQNNALVLREIWERYRYTERSEADVVVDLDFWLRLLVNDEPIVRLGTPLVELRVARPGSQSTAVVTMRDRRRRTFARLWKRHGLTARERGLLAYRLTRSSLGAAIGRRITPRSRVIGARPSVLQVYLDEPGGGPAHVELLRRTLGDQVDWNELTVDPHSPAGWADSIQAIRKAARGRSLIHAHGVRAAAAAFAAARVSRIPLVVTVHGLHLLRRSPGPVSRTATRRALRAAAAVLALSRADRRDIEELGLARHERVHLIRAGFPRRQIPEKADARRTLGLPLDAPVAVWIGRLVDQKDPETFVEAIAQTDPSVIGVMVGAGELHDEVERVVRERALAERVVLLGWVEDPATAIGAADLFVGTSRWEGLAMAPLEAGAAGLPLVLTDAPGYGDLAYKGIPETTVPVGAAERMAKAITDLVSNAPRLQALGRATAEAIEREYPPEGLGEDVLAVYREVIG